MSSEYILFNKLFLLLT